MSYCQRCGSKIAEDASYCGACGTELLPNSGPTPEPDPFMRFAGRTWANAMLGGTAGFALGLLFAGLFVPLYLIGIIAGGLFAGYLQRGTVTSGGMVGALAGALATAPLLLVIAIIGAIGFGTVFLSVAQHAPIHAIEAIGMGVVLVIVGGFVLLVAFTNILFGAVGGLVGASVSPE